MPLNPSPEEHTALEHTLSNIWIARWDDGEQRELVVIPYEAETGMDTGPFVNGEPDYEHAAQLITVDELDELIAALQNQREWLAGGPADWMVIRVMDTAEGDIPAVQGPFSKHQAEMVADGWLPNHRVLSVAVVQLEAEDQ